MLNGSPTPSHSRSPGPPASSVPGLEDSTPPPFVCVSSTLRRLLLQIEIAAPRLHLAALEGEPGTGKHLLAQTIHHQSSLAAQPFRRRDAREWLANEASPSSLSGTLYLDRVDLLASTGQGLLLNLIKVLQSETPAQRFLLLVSAHSTLRQLAGEGLFLPDLAFRLTAVRFAIPPLREHREDIAPITQALIDRICRRYQQPTAVLAPGTLPHLLQHPWPGNVRELASALESAILDSTTGILRPVNLNLDPPQPARRAANFAPNSADGPSAVTTAHNLSVHDASVHDDMALDAVILRHIQLVLELNHGNKLRAARQLGISRSTLYRLLAGESTIAP